MFNSALTYTAIRNFRKNLSKGIDNKKEIIYNNDIENERGNVKMILEKIIVKNAIENIMIGENKVEQLFFFSDEIGFIKAHELYLSEDGIILRNEFNDEKIELDFDDVIYVMLEQEEE